MSSFKDTFSMFQGQFKLTVHDVKSNKSYVHYEDRNLIVYVAKRNVVRMLGGDNLINRYISKMKICDAGWDYINSQLLPTTDPSMTFNDVVPATFEYVIDPVSPTYTDDYSSLNISKVTFNGVMDIGQGNGVGGSVRTYSQAGLFTVDETLQVVNPAPPPATLYTSGLFAIKNFPSVPKTPDLRLVFDWSIIL